MSMKMKNEYDRPGYYPLTRFWRNGDGITVQGWVFEDAASRAEFVKGTDLPGHFLSVPQEEIERFVQEQAGDVQPTRLS